MEADVKSKQSYSSAYYQGNVTVLRKKARQRYHIMPGMPPMPPMPPIPMPPMPPIPPMPPPIP